MNDLQTLTNGDTGYVAKHNSNYAAIKAAIDGLEASLGASFGGALSTAEGFAALFGNQFAVIGSGSYESSGAGTILTVAAGYAWLPVDGLVVANESDATLDFTGVAAGTYYVVVDGTGTPSRSTSSTNAAYSVVWDGAAFGAITRVASLVWAAEDWTAAQASAALGASYESLDARLEAGEAVAVGVSAEVTTARNSAALGTAYGSLDARLEAGEAAAAATAAEVVAARDSSTTGAHASLDARLEAIESTVGGLGGGDVVGPASSTDGDVVLFDGTTGKLIKVGAATGTGNVVRAASPTLTGSVGVGSAANANWAPAGNWAVLDFWDRGTIACAPNGSGTPNSGLVLAMNTYASGNTGPTGQWKYRDNTYAALLYRQRGQQHLFYYAPAGGADPITWTTLFTINPDGFFGAAGAPAMTSGFNMMPAGNGPPTGVPTNASTGYAPLYFDYANAALYAWNTSAAAWQNVVPAQPFDASAFYPGVPGASAKVLRVPIARAVTFPANFVNSVGTAGTAATASTAFDVQKNGASVGTMTFGAGSASATFTSSGGASVSFAAGDVLGVIAPATPDATLADVGLVLAGTR